jgi:hypothetical protein
VLHSTTVRRGCVDQLWWVPVKRCLFKVKSFYSSLVVAAFPGRVFGRLWLPRGRPSLLGQCYAAKPLKFYNRKSKPSRLSVLDDNLITESLSVISAPPCVSVR